MVDISQYREFYTHGSSCSRDNFHPANERGLRTCIDCAGVFDEEGKGVAVTDNRFDENWEERPKNIA